MKIPACIHPIFLFDVDDFGNGTYKRYKKDSFEYCKKVYTSNGKDID